jgi:protein gp37
MHSVAIERRRETRPVVHDEGDIAILRDRFQNPRGTPDPVVVDLLQTQWFGAGNRATIYQGVSAILFDATGGPHATYGHSYVSMSQEQAARSRGPLTVLILFLCSPKRLCYDRAGCRFQIGPPNRTRRSRSEMAHCSSIEWTDSTWNPVTGCTKIGAGCDNCYAERLSERFRGVAGHPFENGFDLTLRPDRLSLPLRWNRPRKIFVNSMSDLFHKEVPQVFVDQVFETMERATWHVFQILTKRSSRMRDYLRARYAPAGAPPPHLWFGVSVEDRSKVSRIYHLRQAPAQMRFLSIEPLIGEIPRLPLDDIDWVIVGGESGPSARPVEISWVREIRDQCLAARVPFFFKQWGGLRAKSGGRTLDGREWNQWPNAPGSERGRLRLGDGGTEDDRLGTAAAHAR